MVKLAIVSLLYFSLSISLIDYAISNNFQELNFLGLIPAIVILTFMELVFDYNSTVRDTWKEESAIYSSAILSTMSFVALSALFTFLYFITAFFTSDYFVYIAFIFTICFFDVLKDIVKVGKSYRLNEDNY